MTSGGARGRSGRAPDPEALRRDRDAAEWTSLPGSGREASTPDWPLIQPTKRELELWEREWTRPQALMWEARGQALEVALYVRAVVVSEGPKANAADRALVLRFLEDLGISQSGLSRNRWKIDSGPAQPLERRSATEGGSAKSRLKLVGGAG